MDNSSEDESDYEDDDEDHPFIMFVRERFFILMLQGHLD